MAHKSGRNAEERELLKNRSFQYVVNQTDMLDSIPSAGSRRGISCYVMVEVENFKLGYLRTFRSDMYKTIGVLIDG